MRCKLKQSNFKMTPRQMELLQLITFFNNNHCYSPTINELSSELNISRSTAFEHISELRRKGLISATPGRARSLMPTSKGLAQLEKVKVDDSDAFLEKATGGLPLAGSVAAGLPVEAVENVEYISLKSCFGRSSDVFALEVRGHSMVGDDIKEGDYVICRRTKTADNGQLVIALMDQENTTLKRFYKDKDAVRLQPANDEYEPIISDDCTVEAVVIGLLRRL